VGQRWKQGSILEITLPDGGVALCQMLVEPEFAFFSPSNRDELLFRLWVHKSAYTNGRWKKIGNAEIPAYLSSEVPRFKQDAISGKLSIYQNGQERPATASECVGLERAAVWDAMHVEERISDYVHGKENVWVKSLALKSST